MADCSGSETRSVSETNESEIGGRQALLYCKTSNGKAAGMPVVIVFLKAKRCRTGNYV